MSHRIKFGGNAEGLVAACPECDSAGQVRKRKQTVNAKGDEPFACDGCGARFEEYVVRESRRGAPGGVPRKNLS